jgi:hypothetical protein
MYEMKFKDEWNPTKEEIEKWAFDTQAYGIQDWELAVYDVKNIDLILGLATDKTCPKRKFFLRCLYVFVGDTVRRNRKKEIDELNEILLKANRYEVEIIKKWIERSRELLLNPESYDYKFWGLSSEYAEQDY